MERNRNGFPMTATDRDNDDKRCEVTEEMSLGDKPLGYAYVPIQRWRMLYDTPAALAHGTLFEELHKPMEVYGNE